MKKLIIFSIILIASILIAQTSTNPARIHIIDRPVSIEGWLKTEGGIWPVWGGKYNLGKAGYRWDSLYVNDGWFYTLRVDSGGTLAGSFTFTDSTTMDKLVVHGTVAFEDTVKGDIITDGIIRNARVLNMDSLPTDSIKGYITFVFDDGHTSHYDSIFSPFTDSGAVGVLAIISSSHTMGGTGWTRVKEMYDAGWEIASHGVTSCSLTTNISSDSAEWELKVSQDTFAAQGIVAKSFVYPYGKKNELVRRLTAKYYNCARTTEGEIETSPINTYSLQGWDFMHDSVTAKARAQIDTTVIKKGWFIVMVHTISQSGANVRTVDSILNIESYARAQGLLTVTLQQGLRYMGNILEVGDRGYVVGIDGKAIMKPRTATWSIFPDAVGWQWTSATQNTLSSLRVRGIGSPSFFDSIMVDSVLVMAYCYEDSNKVDSLNIRFCIGRTSTITTIVADGTDWGAQYYLAHTYPVTGVTIPPVGMLWMEFKPKAESAANKVRIMGMLMYGRTK